MRHPDVPETLDGWHILHRMLRFDRRGWDALDHARQAALTREAMEALFPLHVASDGDVGLAQILGHKADLMLTHYGRSFEDLAAAEVRVDKLGLAHHLEPLHSYVSILELGLYDATPKIHAELRERGLKPHSQEWNEAFDALLRAQAETPHVKPRLWAKIPARRYACFYPMDKKRGETVNWYQLPYAERAALMLEHGKVGRSFHGLVTQVISGSVGLDDWEWGVDLYADDPIVFKRLIYEMRFDEASAKYAAFGPFYTGLQFSISQLPEFLSGTSVPELVVHETVHEPVLS